MPMVSVIMTTHDRPGMVARAIASVLDQTLQDFEVIVVDDGSADETGAVVQAIVRRDPRVRYVWQPSAGPSVARNTGLSLASGKYIAFLDDDDTYLPHKLQVQADYLEQHEDVDLVVGGWIFADEEGEIVGERRPSVGAGLGVETWLLDCPFVVHAPLLRRASIYPGVGFDPELGTQEDWGFWLALARGGCRMRWADRIVCVNTVHSAGLSARYDVANPLLMLQKFFADPTVPTGVRALSGRAISAQHLTACLTLVGRGDLDGASSAMKAAMDACPAMFSAASDDLVDRLASALTQQHRIRLPQATLDAVLGVLPGSDLQRCRLRRRIVGRMYLKKMMEAFRAGQWRACRTHYWSAMRADPRGALELWLLRVAIRTVIEDARALSPARRPRAPEVPLPCDGSVPRARGGCGTR